MSQGCAEGVGVRVGEPVDRQDPERGEHHSGVVRLGVADHDEERPHDDSALDELGRVDEERAVPLLRQAFLTSGPHGTRLVDHSISMPSLQRNAIGRRNRYRPLMIRGSGSIGPRPPTRVPHPSRVRLRSAGRAKVSRRTPALRAPLWNPGEDRDDVDRGLRVGR